MRRTKFFPGGVAAVLILTPVAWAAAEPALPTPKPEEYNLPTENRPAAAAASYDVAPPPCLPPEEFGRLLDAPGLAPVLVLTADRDTPFWRNDTVPLAARAQLQAGSPLALALAAQPGEFRVFQLGLIPCVQDLAGFTVHFSPLTGENGSLAAANFRCLTLGGTGADGQPLQKTVGVARRTVQAVWVGVDVPTDAKGRYRGELRVQPRDGAPISVALTLTVDGAPVAEHGAADAWRLARLRWLDSTIGREPGVTRGFSPVRLEQTAILLQGRRLTLGPQGLLAQVESSFSKSNTRMDARPQPLLAAPLRLVVETAAGVLPWRNRTVPPTPKIESDSAATWPVEAETDGLQLTGEGRVEFDGSVQFRLRLTATRDLAVQDVRLEIPYAEKAASYFMGLGQAGGSRPAALHWKWDVANNHQDKFWLGAVNQGASWKFRGADYRAALVNIYYPFRPLLAPDAWANGGRGGIAFGAAEAGSVVVRVFSGARELRRGQVLDCDFDVMLTPAKPIDTDQRWRDRIVHPSEGAGGNAAEAALRDLPVSTGTLLSIHHRKDQNPFINYPYGAAAFPLLRDFVRDAHAQNARVKVYYTTREVTQHVPELWALHSLGGEIICPGPGAEARTVVNKTGPDPWLVENLRGSFIPAWRATLAGRFNGARDLAVITTPDSRWHNFYLEGLDYLCRHAEIDGIYLDDTALDRASLQRARRILERRRPAPHIDLHSWNHFKQLGSFANSALLYTDLMPYLDRLWLGEGFNYDLPPEFWLVEVAGIPYGVMSDMLQNGGHPWRGMVFGMTARLGWNRGDPRALWRYWDEFGLAGTEMIGWWDPANPVRTGRTDVLATIYCKPKRTLIALASWSAQNEAVPLAIDWVALGLDRAKTRARVAAIKDFQEAAEIDLAAPVVVPANRGLLIELVEVH